jgi:hypothetical protein
MSRNWPNYPPVHQADRNPILYGAAAHEASRRAAVAMAGRNNPAAPARPVTLTTEQRELRRAVREQGKAEVRELAALCLQANQAERLPDILARGLTLDQARAELGLSGSSAAADTLPDALLRTAAKMDAAAADQMWTTAFEQSRQRFQ